MIAKQKPFNVAIPSLFEKYLLQSKWTNPCISATIPCVRGGRSCTFSPYEKWVTCSEEYCLSLRLLKWRKITFGTIALFMWMEEALCFLKRVYVRRTRLCHSLSWGKTGFERKNAYFSVFPIGSNNNFVPNSSIELNGTNTTCAGRK
jgi:hypothetical protein